MRPMIQLISRGRRKAPVKNTRSRWATIAAEEDQRGPVVDLAHDEAGADVERRAGWPTRRPATSRRPAAARSCRGTIVGSRAGLEEEREEDAGDDQDDEAVERDLAEHERPVVREDLVEGLARDLGRAEPVVDPAASRRHAGRRACSDGVSRASPVPVPEAGADRIAEVARSPRGSPSLSTAMGSCGSARVAGPKIGSARRAGTSKVDWWHGHSSRPACAWYSPTGQPRWVQSFE